MRKQTLRNVFLIMVGLVLAGLFVFTPKPAGAANPTTINFQGKVVNATDGTNITNPDNSYSIVFRIYNTSSPTMTTSCTSTASCLWEETQPSVQLTNGVFQVELGSVCALTSSSCNNSTGGPIDFSTNNSLYLTMQFDGDTSGTHGGFMYPLMHITSVPFAFQADNSSTLGGLSAGNFVQLAQGVQTDASTSNASIYINKTGGTANIVTLDRGGTDVFVLDTNGALSLTPNGANAGTVVRQTSGTATSGNIFDIQGQNGTSHFIQVAETAANAGSISITSLGSNDVTIDSGSGTVVLGSSTTTLQKSGANFAIDVSNGGTGSTLTVSNSGGAGNITLDLDSGGSYAVGGTAGTTASACSSGDFITGTLSGGIITSGSCGTPTAYATVQDEGTGLTQRSTINFTGTGVTCADNSGSSRTDCTISGGGSSTLQGAYDNGDGTIALSGGGGLILQDASGGLGTDVSLFALQDNTGTYDYLTFSLDSSSVPHLKVYDGTANGYYVDIYYDDTTSTAVLGASYGTTQIGTGTGNITFGMTAPSNAESHIHSDSSTQTSGDFTGTDFTFTRNFSNFSTTGFNLQGDVFTIEDLSALDSGGANSPNVLYINQNNTSATGNLILAQTGGSTDEFKVDTSGNLTLAGSATVQSATVQSATGLTLGTSSNTGKLTFYSNGNNTVSLQGPGSLSGNLAIYLPSSLGSANQCLMNTGTAGVLQFAPCGGSGATRTVTLAPEYAGAVMTHDNNSTNGSSGTMTSDYCSGSSHLGIPASSNPCGSTQDYNYYSWAASAASANDYDIWTTWQVPSDFSSISSITFYGWTTSTSDAVKLTVYNAGTACGNSTISAASTSFTSTTVSTSSCTAGSAIAAGSDVIFDVDLKSTDTTEFARVSNIVIVYNRL